MTEAVPPTGERSTEANASSTPDSGAPVETGSHLLNSSTHGSVEASVSDPAPPITPGGGSARSSIGLDFLTEKKQAKIMKGHKEFELTYDMMLGIRTTVGQAEAKASRALTERDYVEMTKLSFPKKGSKVTPAHTMRSFKFKDYAPRVFRDLRQRFGLSPGDYLLAICGNFHYLEFISNSKSGQFFFYSHDRKFMIKTVSQAESKFLRRILKDYQQHVKDNPSTLLTRFYGMHRVKPHKKREVHFLVMGSVFFTDKYIHTTFDLKGSLQGRAVSEAEKKNPHCVFKDQDFLEQRMRLKVGPEQKESFLEQIRRDTELLKRLNIMDYSLLVGIHYGDRPVPGSTKEQRLAMSDHQTKAGRKKAQARQYILHKKEKYGIFTDRVEVEVEEIDPAEIRRNSHPWIQSRVSVSPRPDIVKRRQSTDDAKRHSAFGGARLSTKPHTIVLKRKSSVGDNSSPHFPKSSSSPELVPRGTKVNLSSLPHIAKPAAKPMKEGQAAGHESTSSASKKETEDLALEVSFPIDTSDKETPALTSGTGLPNGTGLNGTEVAAIASSNGTEPLAQQPEHESEPVRRQSTYGLPPEYAVFSSPIDIDFHAHEFDIEALPPELPRLEPQEQGKTQSTEIFKENSKFLQHHGGMEGKGPNGKPTGDIYYVGIIDILTLYTTKKRMETRIKTLKYQKSEISAVSSRKYASRFVKFMEAGVD
eukprot:gb/GEZN01002896.1/.p1 GENE.gb/GEZN01002896.1/~~gb/GEZN01002896.1/.p1  ORF type:complete len:703 (+),score=94.56 gb/GEZN01002896.1/:84-2192(+)